MVSKMMIELGEQLTTHYSVTRSAKPLQAVRAALLGIQTEDKKSFLTAKLFLDSSSDTALYFSFADSTEQYWHATVTLYPVGDGTVVVGDVDKWKEVLERGTFKSTVYVDKPEGMERLFASIAAAVRRIDPTSQTTLSSTLPQEVRVQVQDNRTDDPTPVDVRAGQVSSNMYRDVLIRQGGKPLWTDSDGDVQAQWPLSFYGHRRTAPGIDGFIEDEDLFPATRYVLKDLKGMLFATACRLVIYFPYGRNGFMFGTPNADGYVRVGHLRYQWISRVSYSDGKNNFSIVNMLSAKARVTLSYQELNGTKHELTVVLDADPPTARPVAERIRQLVSQHRIEHFGAGDPGLRDALAQPFHPAEGRPGIMEWQARGAISTGEPFNSLKSA